MYLLVFQAPSLTQLEWHLFWKVLLGLWVNACHSPPSWTWSRAHHVGTFHCYVPLPPAPVQPWAGRACLLALHQPGGSSGEEPTCQCRRHKRCWFNPWVGKIPCRRAWPPTPVFLPGESHGQRSLEGYGPGGRRVGYDCCDLACTHTACCSCPMRCR